MPPPTGPIYRLHTQRLIVRCWQPQDAPLLKQAIDESREHLRPWMQWAQAPEPLEAYVQRLRQVRAKFDLDQDFGYGLWNADESRVLGASGLHARVGEGAREIGYWIHQAHLNQGLATEAAAALVRVAFEVDQVNRIEIHCNPENVRSAAVPKKLGFTLEGVQRRRQEFLPGEWRDFMIWTLFRDAYPHSPAAQAAVQAFDVLGQRQL
jgi:RimJ/RimL family protein N-acetyltransferase